MNTLIGKRILIVDDDVDNVSIMKKILEKEECEVATAYNGIDALKEVERSYFSVILLDLQMPEMDGIELMERLRTESPQSLVIILTAYGSVENVEKAVKGKVYDFLDKPIKNKLLLHKLGKAFQYAETLLQSSEAQKQLFDRYPYENIIGRSSKLKKIFKVADKVAPTDTCVLITGETGTGKELVARAIHAKSKLPGPFVAVNAGALAETLLETELFGHEKGAFTDAKDRRYGYFESCKNGTIFLDEIGEISPRMQVSLLRVLQEKKIIRVGGRDEIAVNARVITATNKSLEEMVRQGTFRSDLYFRIKTIEINLPPLRERRDDILLLIDHFIKKSTKKEIDISSQAIDLLKAYNYPGNIRELQGIIEKIMIFLEGDTIQPEDLPAEVTGKNSFSHFSDILDAPWKEAKQAFEKAYIEDKLGKTGWNISEASRIYGMDRSDLHKKINKYNLKK